ncbi:class I SAM-dependent methyltransferase [Lentzea sp. NBRC 102530]|uniref:class I SAM-dependent methyltransferase n=1 Tax=Lentzea sp. NBRC 102530 TaxID=3032201 RepID=UPI0024A3DF39|nr:class I SAM-dependent methyltransferase [Lentzea sp. NBRC 102530]GLY53745.1 methyltransferase [Lentzea sp. NBRC 102530]
MTTAQEFWETFYSERDQVWSGNPNPLLVREAERLTPGSALDVGCAEGGDAVWLAKRGWRVLGVDVSQVALDRALRHAHDAGVEISVEQHDLKATFPEGLYDLVSAQFLHSPVEEDGERNSILKRASDAVAPGGHLVIGGHAAAPSWSPHQDYYFPTTKDVLDHLNLRDNWIIVTDEVVERPLVGPEGQQETRKDNVLTLKRLF